MFAITGVMTVMNSSIRMMLNALQMGQILDSHYKINYPALGMSENDGGNDSGPKMVTSMLKVLVVDKIQACENDYLHEFLHESIKRKYSSYRFCIKFHYCGMLRPLFLPPSPYPLPPPPWLTFPPLFDFSHPFPSQDSRHPGWHPSAL